MTITTKPAGASRVGRLAGTREAGSMTHPYYDDGRVQLYLGDCYDLDEWRAATALVTDPPYGISYKTSASRSALAKSKDWRPIVGDDQPFDPAPFLQFPTVVLFGANHYAHRLPPSSGWLAWNKVDGLTSRRPFGFNDSSDVELAWTNRRMPARIFSHAWIGAMRASERGEQTLHPTQKPVQLMQWILAALTTPDDVIADPFAGSGATLVAAQRLGRRAIGVEIDEAYAETTARRLEQQPLDLAGLDDTSPASDAGLSLFDIAAAFGGEQGE